MTENIETLTDVVDRLCEADVDGDGKISVEEILGVLGERAFGPVFIALALLQLLPTGMIPLVTGLVACLTLLFAWQLLIGAQYPWVPRKVLRVEIEAEKVLSAMSKARPFISRTSGWFRPRANFLMDTWVASRFIAGYAMVLAVMIFFLGFIPAAADPVALALLLLGIGLVAMDGWAVLASYTLTILILTVFFLLAERIFS